MANKFTVPSGQSGRSIDGDVPAHTHVIGDVAGLSEELETQQAGAATMAGDIRAARQEATAAVTTATGAAQVAQAAKSESGDALSKAEQALTAAPKLEAGANISITDNPSTGAKIINATTGGGGEIAYTINNTSPDENGNFNLTAELLNGAPAAHRHAIASIEGLQTALNGKAAADHTHELVSGIQIGNSVISGAARYVAGDNVSFEVAGSTITVNVNAEAAGAAAAVQNLANAGGGVIKLFVGTAAQWEALTKETGVKYLVNIVEA